MIIPFFGAYHIELNRNLYFMKLWRIMNIYSDKNYISFQYSTNKFTLWPNFPNKLVAWFIWYNSSINSFKLGCTSVEFLENKPFMCFYFQNTTSLFLNIFLIQKICTLSFYSFSNELRSTDFSIVLLSIKLVKVWKKISQKPWLC